MMDNVQGPLARFTVLDLTRVRAGPTAVRQLADWGANIIKIEPPENIDEAKTMGGPAPRAGFSKFAPEQTRDDFESQSRCGTRGVFPHG